MPVLQREAPHRKLSQAIADELDSVVEDPSEVAFDVPLVIEEDGWRGTKNVFVVWDAFERVDPSDRGDAIRYAYELANRSPESVRFAIGLTGSEAKKQRIL